MSGPLVDRVGQTGRAAIGSEVVILTVRNERATAIDECCHSYYYVDYMRNSRDTFLWGTMIYRGTGASDTVPKSPLFWTGYGRVASVLTLPPE